MRIYKVMFKDGNVRRSIKVEADNAYGAIKKAQALRNGTAFVARIVMNDDRYFWVR